jgi:hypothetical protein
MRKCTAHYDVLMPAMFAGTASWSERAVWLSIAGLVNQPSGY